MGKIIPDGQNVRFQYRVVAGQFDSDTIAQTGGLGFLEKDDTLIKHGEGQCTNDFSTTGLRASGAGNSSMGIPRIASSNWFYATAVGDQDGDGNCSLFIKVIDRTELAKENETE